GENAEDKGGNSPADLRRGAEGVRRIVKYQRGDFRRSEKREAGRAAEGERHRRALHPGHGIEGGD
ncbi:unnamed protein product, partial [Amoebophrya sp. A120]